MDRVSFIEIFKNMLNRNMVFKWHDLSSYINKTFYLCTIITNIFILTFRMLGNSIAYYENYELEIGKILKCEGFRVCTKS